MLKKIKEFIAKETVLCVAAVCAILTMFLVPPDKEYLHYIDFRVLCLLLCLMAVVAGLKAIGIFDWLTYQLLRRINNGHTLSVTLVLLPFFSSMFVTNDVALIIFIPFTLALLQQLGCSKSIIPVTVFQTIAANLGSMATPVGNPQNLYLYAFYNLSIGEFFSVTLPLTAVSLIALTIASLPLLPKKLPYIYIALVGAMLAGRAVWGLAYWAITSAMGMDFTFIMFLTSAFAKALPGIAIQIVLIPPIVLAVNKTKKQS